MSNQQSAVERLEQGLEGKPTAATGTNDIANCDFCGRKIFPGDRVSIYLADKTYTDVYPDGQYTFLRMYGECHRRKRVLFPCGGVSEIVATARLSREKTIEDVSVVSISPSSDGPPWHPPEIYGAITRDSFTDFCRQFGIAGGPEDVVDALTKIGLDIREYVAPDGQPDVTPTDRERIRDKVTEFAVDSLEQYGGVKGLQEYVEKWNAKQERMAEKFDDVTTDLPSREVDREQEGGQR